MDACVDVGECSTEVGCAACLALTEQVIVSGYDAAGRLLEHTYQPGTDAEVSHTFAYDSLGRLIYGASPDTGERGYTWSDEGRLLQSESLVGASLVDTVEFTYDEAGRLLTRRGLDAGGDYDETWTFRYDAPVGVSPASSPETWGLLTAVTGPDGVATTAYDRMNRPIRTVRSIKDLVTESEFSVIRQMTLSPGGRVVASTIGTPRVGVPSIVDERIRLEHGYDRAGRLRHLGVGLEGSASAMLWEGLELTPSGATTLERLGNQVGTRYVRDVLDQVQGVSLSADAISIRDTDWAGWGAPANTTLWNPATHTFEAAGVEAFATAFEAVSSGAIRYEVGLSRNAYGALTAVADSAVAPGVRSRDAAFEYDLAGRLVAAEVSEHHFEYAYDALQNMTRRELVVVPGGAITPDLLSGDYRHGHAATGKRRLQQVTMPGTSTALATFSYDLAGRMTRVGLSAATDTTMAFDAFDRVRVVDEPGSGLTQHRYDAAGERATTVWADGRIERYFGGGLTQREGRLELHVGLGGARVVARVNVPELPDGTASISDGLGGAPAVVYLHQGVGHGPTVVTDAGGEVIEERVFEPYGTPLWVDADYELERLGYNGKVVDPSTGWSDHGARWHATRFARWLSVDPPLKGPGGLVEHGLAATPYGFVAGNPVMFWDPDGRNPGLPHNLKQTARNLLALAFATGDVLEELGIAVAEEFVPGLGPANDIAEGDYLGASGAVVGSAIPADRVIKRIVRIIDRVADNRLFRSAYKRVDKALGVALKQFNFGEMLDKVLDGAERLPATHGPGRLYRKSGGYERALQDFHSLELSDVVDLRLPDGRLGKMGTLPDGKKVVVRDFSSGKDSKPTLEFQTSDYEEYKVRYYDK